MTQNSGEIPEIERVPVWQCIGCGKIEAPQPCIGVCEDRRVQMVYAYEHDQVVAQLLRKEKNVETLTAFVRRFIRTTPRAGEWETSYRALQEEARRLLVSFASASPDTDKQREVPS